jgi:RsiW-degrading membrane proteinase PrsW (M82 family)
MPHLDVTQASVIIGIVCTIIVLLITVLRQKRFDVSDLGSFVGAFFSGTNIPPVLFLCFYIFMLDPGLSATRLKGYEKYISLAGLVLFLASLMGVWKFCKTAWPKAI